jgi:hypothetical protein
VSLPKVAACLFPRVPQGGDSTVGCSGVASARANAEVGRDPNWAGLITAGQTRAASWLSQRVSLAARQPQKSTVQADITRYWLLANR